MGQSLLEISEDMRTLDELLEESESFDDLEVQKQLNAWSAEINNNMLEKVDNYAAFITVLEGRALVRKEESKRLAARANTDENAAKRLKDFLKTILEFRNIKKLDADRYTVSVQKNGGKQAMEILVQPKDLPDVYKKQETVYSAKKDVLYKDLFSGIKVGGCRLLPRGSSLRIR